MISKIIVPALSISSGFACNAFGAPLAFTPVRAEGVDILASGTFASNSHKIVENQYGIFMTYEGGGLYQPSGTQCEWRLARSTNGGASFQVIYRRDCGAVLANGPAIETDENGRLYLFATDASNGSNANLLRFDPEKNFQNPLIKVVPGMAATGKLALYYDPGRRILYAAGHTTFVALDLDGNILRQSWAWDQGPNAQPQYPYFAMSGSRLFMANSNALHTEWGYWSFHWMISDDAGATWRHPNGTRFTLPVVADNTGPAPAVVLADEYGNTNWLASMIAKGGYLHFQYSSGHKSAAPTRQHYVRVPETSATADVNIYPTWQGATINLGANMDGFFTTNETSPNSPLFAVGQTFDGRIGILQSTDLGRTWQDYAQSAPINGHIYWPAGARSTKSGAILGHYTMDDAQGRHLMFFRVPVPGSVSPDTTPPTVSLTIPAANATVSGTVTVAGTASDNVAVAGVQFKVNGANIGAEDTTAPYSASLNTLTLANGAHTLTAVARDAAGNMTTSASRSITISNPAPPPPPPAGLIAMRAPAPLTIDGSLADWSGAKSVSFSGLNNSATVYALWDAANLYFAFRVKDAQLNASQTARDSGSAWEDDNVEIFLDTLNNKSPDLDADDYHIMVNLNNAQYDSRGGAAGEDAAFNLNGLRSAVALRGSLNNNADSDTDAIIEVAIPLAQLAISPASGTIMGMDLAVDDSDAAGFTYFDFAQIAPNAFAQPQLWKSLSFTGALAGPPPAGTDLNGDGTTNVADVQLAVNQALGITACGNGDVDANGACSVVDVQRVVVMALGQ